MSMKVKLYKFISNLIFTIFLIMLPSCATVPQQDLAIIKPGAYRLDPNHARVNWAVSHAGLSQYTARFDRVSGSLDFDPDNVENSQLFIRIDPKSVSTGLAEFDERLSQGSRYFDAETYPEITFIATQSLKTGDNTGRVTGDLTLKGITKPVTLEVSYNGAGKSFGNPGKTLGFSATGRFSRSEFNLGYLKNFGIGDEVTLQIEAEFNEAQNEVP